MRVLLLWHAAADPHNRPIFDALIRRSGLEALILAPRRVEDRLVHWRLDRPVVRRNPATGSSYRIEPVTAFRAHRIGHLWYPGLPVHLLRFRPEVIHLASGEAAQAVSVETMLARPLFAPRARVVLMMIQNIVVDYRWPWPVLERFVLRRADRPVAYSPGALAVLRRRGVRGPIPIQPFGLDARAFRPGRPSPIRRRMGPGAPVIGWVGRMFLGKGLQVLLEASARMQRPHRLLIVGDGPRRDEERRHAERLRIADRVTWVGPATPDAMPGLYAAMDIYTHPAIARPSDLPAWKEQFARTLPEAMLSGVPVVGSRSGEIPWVIGDGGLIVPERNSAALARALDRLVSSRARRHALGRQGRARALAHFTCDVAAAGLMRIWRDVASG